MKRRENVKKRISVLTLAGMLAVSACPLSASAENIPDSAAGAEEVQASSAEDVPEDSGSLWKEETDLRPDKMQKKIVPETKRK